MKPYDFLLPYQKQWVDDRARFKFGLMSRQTGKDFSGGYDGIRDCLEWELKKQPTRWTIAAPSERQSLDSLDQWKSWAEVFELELADVQVERDGGPESLLKAATITFPHGSSVRAVPGKPDTVRGPSSNVFFTEFAFFEQPDLTWRAIWPMVTNSMRGGEKRMSIVTTPNGIGNKAHDIWKNNFGKEGALWSCHKVTIHDAFAQGLNANSGKSVEQMLRELREGMDDPEGFAQEFECEFIDLASTLLPYELIATCESADCTTAMPPEFWNAGSYGPPIDLGIDFGRVKDLTCCWANQQLGDVSQTIEVLTLEKMSTPKQVEILSPRIARCRRACLDYTGPGVGLGDYLVEKFGEWKPEEHKFGRIELCTMSNTLKVDIFSKLRMHFEKRALRVPINRTIREDLHSMSRGSTKSGLITYRAPHTEDGHADRCTGLALAMRALSFSGSGALLNVSGIRLGGQPGLRPIHTPRVYTPFRRVS